MKTVLSGYLLGWKVGPRSHVSLGTHFTVDAFLHPAAGLCLPQGPLTPAGVAPRTHVTVDALLHPVAQHQHVEGLAQDTQHHGLRFQGTSLLQDRAPAKAWPREVAPRPPQHSPQLRKAPGLLGEAGGAVGPRAREGHQDGDLTLTRTEKKRPVLSSCTRLDAMRRSLQWSACFCRTSGAMSRSSL